MNSYDEPHMNVRHEFNFNGTVVDPGTNLWFRGSTMPYRFRCLVTDTRTGAQWIDAVRADNQVRSFSPSNLMRAGAVKRSWQGK
jgi:hypothetical protein